MPDFPALARVPDPSGRLSSPTPTRSESAGQGVLIRYWAGARMAAGVAEEWAAPGTIGELVAGAGARHTARLAVLPVCAILLDGIPVRPDVAVPAGAVVEVLPPFAGG